MDRGRARRILGLSERAGAAEQRAAYLALEEHVRARLETSTSDEDRDARQRELLDLEDAWRALSASAPPARGEGATRSVGSGTPRTRVLVAVASAGLVALAGVWLVTRGPGSAPRVLVSGDGSGAGEGQGAGYALPGADAAEAAGTNAGGDEALDAGSRARLVADSGIEGAVLEVTTREEQPEVVATGAADDSVYWLSPGAYEIEVSHPDCADAWSRELDPTGEQRLDLSPEICEDTGWMVVRSNLSGDELLVDGKSLGPTGERRHPVAPGEHEVRVEKVGFRAWEGIVEVEAGRVLGIRPRLEPVERAAAAPRPAPAASPAPGSAASPAEGEGAADAVRREGFESWHEDARRWLLSRYDFDRSGALDTREEVEAVPCEHWVGLEQSYDQSRLGLSLVRFYGFDGNGWRSGALGVADPMRDVAYARMQSCGMR